MTPIHELLNRLRWDKDFAQGRFELGDFDRREGTIQRVALRDVVFPEEERRLLQVRDGSGRWRRIPLHRVREVWRDGQLTWRRPG